MGDVKQVFQLRAAMKDLLGGGASPSGISLLLQLREGEKVDGEEGSFKAGD